MSQPITRSRLYSGLFLCILLIVIPYLIGGTAGVVVALVFAAVVGSLTWLVMGFNGLPVADYPLPDVLTSWV